MIGKLIKNRKSISEFKDKKVREALKYGLLGFAINFFPIFLTLLIGILLKSKRYTDIVDISLGIGLYAISWAILFAILGLIKINWSKEGKIIIIIVSIIVLIIQGLFIWAGFDIASRLGGFS